MLRERPDAVEADLQRFYGVDVRDRWIAGPHRLTWRRLAVLISNLPPEAACHALPTTDGRRMTHPSAVEFRLLELAGMLSGEPHPALERLDDARARAAGAEVKSVLGAELRDRAARYAGRSE